MRTRNWLENCRRLKLEKLSEFSEIADFNVRVSELGVLPRSARGFRNCRLVVVVVRYLPEIVDDLCVQ